MRRNDLSNDEKAALAQMERTLLFKLWIPAVSVLIGLLIQLFLAGTWVGDVRRDIQNVNHRIQRIEAWIDNQ